MSDTIAERFIEGLRALEESRNADGLVSLFTQDAEVGNVVAPEKFHGLEGARDFWTKYRDTFEKVKSTFRNRIIDENRIALEWNTVGKAVYGAPVEYSGVSILEVSGEKISRFRAYFDPAALGRQMDA
jgi:predicted ester cyclase